MTDTSQSALSLCYPNAPGYQPTTTSRLASICAQERAAWLRPRVLELLRAESLTCDELAERLGETILNIRPRVSELRALGKIADSGNRRENAGGHFTIVWRATP